MLCLTAFDGENLMADSEYDVPYSGIKELSILPETIALNECSLNNSKTTIAKHFAVVSELEKCKVFDCFLQKPCTLYFDFILKSNSVFASRNV